MIKNFTTSFALIVSAFAFSQVGINTDTPKSTLDVSAARGAEGVLTDNTQTYGIQAPRLTRAELTDNTGTYGADQTGSLIYITDISGGSATGSRVNITQVGYYYFDGSLWQTVKGAEASPLNIYNANGSLTSDRTLTLSGRELNFTGSIQRTSWGSNGVLYQENQEDSGSAAMSLNGGGGASLWIQQFYNSNAQIQAQDNATSLLLSTSGTTASAPIVFNTSSGGGALGTEKMRITGEGNVGINTQSPTERFHVNGNVRLQSLPLNGATDAIFTIPDGDASSSQDQTFTATRTIVADANGVLGYVDSVPSSTSTDGTRFLGGTAYVRFNTTSGGTLPLDKVIGGANGVTYSVGSLSPTSSRGGINSVIGNGYTISNPTAGIFDIKFNIPMNEIYGISVNIVDAYGTTTGTTATNPDPLNPGVPLRTNDNTQVSFISNSIIRVKTGNSNGDLSNRSFTFLVTGK